MNQETVVNRGMNALYTGAKVQNKVFSIILKILAIIILLISILLFIFVGWKAGLISLVIAGIFYGLSKIGKIFNKSMTKRQEKMNKDFQEQKTI